MKRLHSNTGAALVEMAITIPALLLIFGGIAEFGLLFRTHEVTTNAAREGARLGALPGNEGSDYAVVRARVEAYLADAGLTGPHTVTVVPETMPLGTGTLIATGTRVTISYTYSCRFLGPIAGLINGSFASTINLQSSALMRVQIGAVGS